MFQATYGGGGTLRGQRIAEEKQKAGREWREISLSPKGREAGSLETQSHRRAQSVHYEQVQGVRDHRAMWIFHSLTAKDIRCCRLKNSNICRAS